MGRIFKRDGLIVVALVLIFLMLIPIGCSREKEESQKTKAKTEAKVGKEKVIKIGAILPLTGDAALYGKRALKGLSLAVEEVNSSGGIVGKKIVLIVEDSKSDSKWGVSAANKLINLEHVKVIIGALMSSVTLSIAPICERNRVILLSPGSSNPKISKAGDYIFRNWPSDSLEGSAMALYATKYLGLKRVAVIAIKNDYGEGLLTVFSQCFKRLGGKISYSDFYDKDSNFRELALKAVRSNPDAIYLPGHASGIAILCKMIRELDDSLQILSAVGAESPDIIKIAGCAAEGMIYTSPTFASSKSPVYLKFKSLFKEKYDEDPEIFSATAYDAIFVIKKAMELAGSTCDTDKIKDAMYEVKIEGASGMNIFDKNGDVVKPIAIKIIRNGTFQVIQVIQPKLLLALRYGENE